MKKIFFIVTLTLFFVGQLSAQKFALIDMEYILKNIPAYEMANEQLNQVSKRWQGEVEKVAKDAETMYKNYEANMVFLSEEMKKKEGEKIVTKEKETRDLRNKYFGPEGELFKKRESLMQPIQDDIYNAVKQLSEEKGYQLIMDRASAPDIIYASPRIDISNEVLGKLGYSK